jgi:WD40 repeat protein
MTDGRVSPDFIAHRDNRGAFAIGAEAKARNVEASVYIENYAAGVAKPSVSGPIYYNLPSLPPRYQPRAAELREVRNKLLGGSPAIGITSAGRALGLKGMGGIGKTVLATALVHDPDIRAAFSDGIAWITVGRNAPVLAKAAELAFALTGGSWSFQTVSEARGQIGLLTQGRRILVVLDDVWEPIAVDPFLGLGTHGRVLITTRDLHALERAEADVKRLDLLDPEGSRLFLSEASGVEILPSEVDEVIRQCGFLPLALAAIGALIRKRIYDWTDVLALVREGAVEELDTSWLPDPDQSTLAVVLNLSVDALRDRVRACWLDCAVLREDVDIPEEAAFHRLWSGRVKNSREIKRVVEELVERSLLHRDDRRHYRIHDLYFDHLRHIAAPLTPRHEHVIAAYNEACEGIWSACPDDGYGPRNLPWHMHQAGQYGSLRALLFDPAWIQLKLRVAGLNSLLKDYELLEDDPEASRVAAALQLSSHVLDTQPELLAVQLCGRLLAEDGPSIARLLAKLRCAEPQPFMPIVNGYLTRPGALLRTILVRMEISHMAVLASQRIAVLASKDRGADYWHWRCTLAAIDLRSGARLWRTSLERGYLNELELRTDGGGVLLVTRDCAVILGLQDGSELHRFDWRDPDRSHFLAPEGVALLTREPAAILGYYHGWLETVSLEDWRTLRSAEIDGSIAKIAAIDDDLLACGCSDGTVRILRSATGDEVSRFESPRRRKSRMTSLEVLKSRYVLTGWSDGSLELWDAASGESVGRLEDPGDGIGRSVLLRDGHRVLAGSQDGGLRVWDLRTGGLEREFTEHLGAIRGLAVLDGDREAVSGSTDGTVRLWDLSRDPEKASPEWHRGRVTALTILADGSHALTGANDGTIRLWNLETGGLLRCYPGHLGRLVAICVFDGVDRAISAASDGIVRVFNLATGEIVLRSDGTGERIAAAVTLGDKALFVSEREAAWLFDPRDGSIVRRFEGTQCSVDLMTETSDDPAYRWDFQTAEEIAAGDADCEMLVSALDVGGHLAWSTLTFVNALPYARSICFRSRANPSARDDHRDVRSNGSSLVVLDRATDKELARFDGEEEILSLALSPDGVRAATGDARGRVMAFVLPR